MNKPYANQVSEYLKSLSQDPQYTNPEERKEHSLIVIKSPNKQYPNNTTSNKLMNEENTKNDSLLEKNRNNLLFENNVNMLPSRTKISSNPINPRYNALAQVTKIWYTESDTSIGVGTSTTKISSIEGKINFNHNRSILNSNTSQAEFLEILDRSGQNIHDVALNGSEISFTRSDTQQTDKYGNQTAYDTDINSLKNDFSNMASVSKISHNQIPDLEKVTEKKANVKIIGNYYSDICTNNYSTPALVLGEIDEYLTDNKKQFSTLNPPSFETKNKKNYYLRKRDQSLSESESNMRENRVKSEYGHIKSNNSRGDPQDSKFTYKCMAKL